MRDFESFLIKEAVDVVTPALTWGAGKLAGGLASRGAGRVAARGVGNVAAQGAKGLLGKLWGGAKDIGKQTLAMAPWMLIPRLWEGGEAQAQAPAQVQAQPGMPGYGARGGYRDDSGYTPFSSQGMEDFRRTPRYQMGQLPMYAQQPFMQRRAGAESSSEQQLAFDHGVDLFCKQAGFDEDDRLVMHALVKKAWTYEPPGAFQNTWDNIKSFWGFGDNPARKNDPNYWTSNESQKERDELNAKRSREGKVGLNAKQWSDYFTGSARDVASRNPMAAEELSKGQSGEFGKGNWLARTAITAGLSAPFGLVGGVAANALPGIASSIYQGSKDSMTPGVPGSAPQQPPTHSPYPDMGGGGGGQQAYLPGGGGFGWNAQNPFPVMGAGQGVGGQNPNVGRSLGYGGTMTGGWMPGGDLDRPTKTNAEAAAGRAANLDAIRKQRAIFEQSGRDRDEYEYATALNNVLGQGNLVDRRLAIIQAARGKGPLMQRLANELGVQMPGGFRSTQAGDTRWDPSGGTSAVTRSAPAQAQAQAQAQGHPPGKTPAPAVDGQSTPAANGERGWGEQLGRSVVGGIGKLLGGNPDMSGTWG